MSGTQPAAQQRFRELADRWKRDSRLLSSTTAMATLPSYQQIIGLGPAALPWILEELEREADHWFWARGAITGVDPVAPAHRGRIEAMRGDWLRWAREAGLAGEPAQDVPAPRRD